METFILLSQVITVLEQFKEQIPEVRGFAYSLPDWVNACGFPYHSSYAQRVDERVIKDLKMFSAFIAMAARNGGNDMQAALRSRFSEEVRILVEAIDNDTSLDPALQSHARVLIDHILECLQSVESAGMFNLREAVQKLRIYVDAARFQTKDEDARKKYDKFYNFCRDVAIQTGSSLISERVLLALSGN
ncbi:hypothetical protein [Rothia sp. ND6WE1A]|uniref:hypothetical protein n=1 Tax=Rothia sp. ND6WE1A TaxID=1848190 RepID=UPI0011477841|nr:hypothetical protein [Rothia sp. ND6WE1A]